MKRSTRVLLVEDHPTHRSLLEDALLTGPEPVTVASIDDVDRFRKLIRRRRFDCLVTDYHLPSARADSLIAELNMVQPDCPVVVVSSSRSQDVVIASMRQGGTDFIPKEDAFDPVKLWDRLEQVLAKARWRKRERRERQRRERELLAQAYSDPLTGLLNRRGFEELSLNGRRQRSDRRGVAVVAAIDLDHFKHVNDTHGHTAGDMVLRAVARVMREFGDNLAHFVRWGGEEFIAVRSARSVASGVAWFDRLRAEVEDLDVRYGGTRIPVTVSIGVSWRRTDANLARLIERADRALYLAKQSGRNRVCTWEMVRFQRLVTRVSAPTPEIALHDILSQGARHLGPTQLQHLTRHSRRVGYLAVQIGEGLGMSRESLHRLWRAALLHDIAKFLVPEHILAKPRKLNPHEQTQLHWHAERGADMAAELGLDGVSCDFIRFHHDRYSNNLQARNQPQVPLGARVINLADALEAMAARRNYSRKMTPTSVMAELRKERGGQFDPLVVDAALRIFAEKLLPVLWPQDSEAFERGYAEPKQLGATRGASVSPCHAADVSLTTGGNQDVEIASVSAC